MVIKFYRQQNIIQRISGLDKATLVGRESGIKVNGVLADGTANTVTAPAESYYQRLATISRQNVLNGDYIKLRQLSFGYTVSPESNVARTVI